MTLIFEERPSNSPLIEKIWYTQSESEKATAFTSHAISHSEIVVAKFDGKTTVTVRGPETIATPASAPPDGEFFGIVFKLGTFMPALPPQNLKDLRDTHLPVTNHKSFWLDSSMWEIPNFDNADIFVNRLIRQGLLVHDHVIDATLQGQPQAFSPRALQYRFVRATGLSLKVIQQIERAQQAQTLLQQGIPIINTAYEVGYFDQSHLTNSLKRFIGQTPAQIAQDSQAR